ncbi:hypothetical protein ABZ801_26635 [Actinomadura sp. NPDC047616]|uniref:hypothetical protein n=1 Tax=Actinomadura sp. NPDC047616 TaxID=3155914 RepID=UPI0033CBEC5E
MTLVVGIATFLAYSFLVALPVLHEPVVAGAMHGAALGWMVLWALFYVLCLNGHGLPRPETDQPS